MEEESAPSAGARGLSPAGVLRPARFSLRRWGELGWSSRRGRTGAEEQESAVDVGVWNGWTENIWARITAYQAMASIKRSKLLAIPAKAWPSGRPRYAWSPHKRSLRDPDSCGHFVTGVPLRLALPLVAITHLRRPPEALGEAGIYLTKWALPAEAP